MSGDDTQPVSATAAITAIMKRILVVPVREKRSLRRGQRAIALWIDGESRNPHGWQAGFEFLMTCLAQLDEPVANESQPLLVLRINRRFGFKSHHAHFR